MLGNFSTHNTLRSPQYSILFQHEMWMWMLKWNVEEFGLLMLRRDIKLIINTRLKSALILFSSIHTAAADKYSIKSSFFFFISYIIIIFPPSSSSSLSAVYDVWSCTPPLCSSKVVEASLLNILYTRNQTIYLKSRHEITY